MKIAKLVFKKSNLRLAQSFSYADCSLAALPYALVIVETDNNIRGLGEAALAPEITGETQKSALGFHNLVQPLLLGQKINNLEDIARLMERVNKQACANSAAKSGLEMALMDALGKFHKKPVYRLFGRRQQKKSVEPQTVLSFEEQTPENLLYYCQRLSRPNSANLKLKVADDFLKKLAWMKKIFLAHPRVKIVLDVNQGWSSPQEALRIIKQLSDLNVRWIEQPDRCQDYAGLANIKKAGKIPIMADESCHNLLDLKNLHRLDAVDMINIKLAKTGGILEALRMVVFCEKHGLKYMLGDMINSAIGNAANLHTALLGNFAAYDLTFPSRLKKNLATGIIIKGRNFFVPQKPGLGIILNT